MEDGQPLYLHVAGLVADKWNANGQCGLVVGATFPNELAAVRQRIGDAVPLLVPGIGAQGGDITATVNAGANNAQRHDDHLARHHLRQRRRRLARSGGAPPRACATRSTRYADTTRPTDGARRRGPAADSGALLRRQENGLPMAALLHIQAGRIAPGAAASTPVDRRPDEFQQSPQRVFHRGSAHLRPVARNT